MMPINHFETGVAETGAEVQAHWNLIVDAANDATEHIDTDGNPHDSQLAELSDVDTTDREDGFVIAWDEGAQQYHHVEQGGGGDVTSVFGRTGDVVATEGDYTPEQVGADPEGTAATAVSNHVGELDPHTQYQLESEKGAASGYAPLDGDALVPLENLPGMPAAAHAETHQDGGDDEVATTTPASGAIPKAGTDSKLPAGFIDTLTASSPSQTLVDSAEEDRWTKVQRIGGETAHTSQVTGGWEIATEKPANPILDEAYTVAGEGQPLATDLLLDYPLNEGSGGTAGDLSTNNNDGTITGPTWDTDADLLRSPLLTFDGSDDYVDCGAVADWEWSDPWTVFVRARTSVKSATHQKLLCKMASPLYNGWAVSFYDGKVCAFLSADGVTPYSLVKLTDADTHAGGDWHDIVVSYDGSHVAAGVSIYVGGALVAATATNDNLTSGMSNAANLVLGKRNDSSYPLDGDIAQVSIWERVLSADEVAALTSDPYQLESAPATEKPASPVLDEAYTVPDEEDPLATDLLLDYVMDEGSGGTIGDLASGNHDGTIMGPVWDTDADLLRSPLLTFDGADDYVGCGDVGDFEYNLPFSVFFRFRTSNGGPGVEQVVLGKANSGVGVGDDRARGWIAITYEGRIGLALSNNEYNDPPGYIYRSLGVWTTGTGFCDGNWHDVLLTYDGTYVEAAIEIYVDGALEAHTAWTDCLGANTIANAEDLNLGIRLADSAFPYDGDLAHVTLWDRVLSADEAAALTNNPYRMEGAGNGVTNDVAYLTVDPPTEDGDVADVTIGQADTLVSVPGKLVVVNGRLRCVANSKYGPPVSGTYAVGDLWLDRAGSLWQCSVAGEPGTWVQLEPGRQTTAQWTNFDTLSNWNGGAKLADYRCFEPDVAMEWAYDATYGWLGRHWEAISEHTSDVTSNSQYRLGILPRVHDLLLTHAMAYTGTTATCDGSNYWTVRLVKGYLSGGAFTYTACTDDVVRNTVANLEVTWTPDGVVIDTDVYGWYARQYAKTGSPGTLTFGHVGVTFRYVRK